MIRSRILFGLAASVLALAGFSTSASAQIGSGWTSVSETYKVQLSGSGWNSGSQFGFTKLTDSTDTIKDRAEREYNTWSSGMHQFQGDVTVNSFSGDRVCIKQTFQPNKGPWNMVGVEHSGTIYEVEGGNSLGSFTVGTSFRVNTVLDATHGTVQVYINGSLKETKSSGVAPFYDKLGAYRTASGTPAITVTWSNIKFWQK